MSALASPDQLVRRRTAHRAHPATGRPGAAWALPGLLFFVLFAVVPMIAVAYLSFTDWDGLSAPRLNGGANWARLVRDPAIVHATVVTFVLLIGNMVVQAPIAILLGVWSAGLQRNRAALSTIFFVPLVLSTAATAVMWRQLLDPNFGVPSKLPWLFGGDGNFVGTSNGAIVSLVAVTSWQFIPFHTLLFQASARAIPHTLYQAAELDGAGRVRQFLSITLPQLRNTIVTSSTFMVIGGLTAFDIVLVLTNGGPGTDTATLPFRMYQEGFTSYDMGYASAIAVVLLALATGLSLLLVRVTGYDKMQSTLEGL
jgi:xylobiose transport system permease protein